MASRNQSFGVGGRRSPAHYLPPPLSGGGGRSPARYLSPRFRGGGGGRLRAITTTPLSGGGGGRLRATHPPASGGDGEVCHLSELDHTVPQSSYYAKTLEANTPLQSVFLAKNPKRTAVCNQSSNYAKTLEANTALQSVFLDTSLPRKRGG